MKTHIESSEAQKILVEREKAILMKIKGISAYGFPLQNDAILFSGPFLVRCYHIFEDSEKLYFVMECASGGELFVHLSREKVCVFFFFFCLIDLICFQIFDPERVRFYAAEMFLGLE